MANRQADATENRTSERAGEYENRTISETERARLTARENGRRQPWFITDETIDAARLMCSELVDKAPVPCDEVWGRVYAVLCPRKLPPGATSTMRHCRARAQRFAYLMAGNIVRAKLNSIIAVDGPFAADYEPAIEQNKALLEQRERQAEQAHEAKLAEQSERLVAQSGQAGNTGSMNN